MVDAQELDKIKNFIHNKKEEETLKEISNVILEFKNTSKKSIEYGNIRGNCGVVASDFVLFAKKYNIEVKRVFGYFLIENPNFDKKDFLPEEIQKMKKLGYDFNSKKDRKSFSEKENLTFELKKFHIIGINIKELLLTFLVKHNF